ncbi:hypothetical protein AB5I41_19745 [Sphingomonas sp. MMS24-JH45]
MFDGDGAGVRYAEEALRLASDGTALAARRGAGGGAHAICPRAAQRRT